MEDEVCKEKGCAQEKYMLKDGYEEE